MANTELIRFLTAVLPYAQEYEEKYLRLLGAQSRLAEAERLNNESAVRTKSLGGFLKGMGLFNTAGTALALLNLALNSNKASGAVTLAVFAVLAAVPFLIRRALLRKQEEQKIAAAEQVRELEAEAAKTEEEIKRFLDMLNQNGVFEILPTDYFYPYAVEQLTVYLRKTLADTMKEAILLYEGDLKREEANEQQMLMNQSRLQAIHDVENAVNFNTVITWLTADRR